MIYSTTNHNSHNHDGVLARRSFNVGGAEKFIDWAKSEKLSFWK